MNSHYPALHKSESCTHLEPNESPLLPFLHPCESSGSTATVEDPDDAPVGTGDDLLDLVAKSEEQRQFDIIWRSIRNQSRSRSMKRSRSSKRTHQVLHVCGKQVNWEEARMAVTSEMRKIQFDERIFAKPPTEALQADIDCTEEFFYDQCSNRIDSILKSPEWEDLDFYIGVSESPRRRFYEQGGHCYKYHSMHIVGAHARSRLIASVEKTLIHTKKEFFSDRCKKTREKAVNT